MPPTNLLTPSKPCSQEGVVQQPHHSLGRHIEVHLLQVELTAVQGCHRPLCLSPHLNIPATHKNIHFLSFFIHTHSLTSFSHTHSLTSCTYTHLSTLPPSTHTYFSSPILSPPSSHMRTSPHFPFLCHIHLSAPPYSVHPHSHLFPPPIVTSLLHYLLTLTSPPPPRSPSPHLRISPHPSFILTSPSPTLSSPSFPYLSILPHNHDYPSLPPSLPHTHLFSPPSTANTSTHRRCPTSLGSNVPSKVTRPREGSSPDV